MTPLQLFRRLGLGLCLSLTWIVLATATPFADEPNLAGTWKWEWKDGQGVTHHHTLEVEGTGQKLAARERFDDLAPVKVDDLKVEGRKVSFAVQRDKRRAEYSGTVADADTINGRVQVVIENQTSQFTWTAKRVIAEKK